MLLKTKYNYKSTFIVVLVLFGFVLNCIAQTSRSEGQNSYIKNEIEFAGTTFSLSEVSKLILNQEIQNLNSNSELKEWYLANLTLVLPIVEKSLKDSGVPQDFKYLCVYNRFQKSTETTALLEKGIYWCFDKAKASDVDVLVNEYLDERRHIVAATDGAVLCLKKNQVMFENWGATLFAHIASKEVLSALEISKKWRKSSYMTLNSPAYFSIIQFLAFKIVMEQSLPYYKPLDPKVLIEFPNDEKKTLGNIAAELKIDLEVLKSNNLWLKNSKYADTENAIILVTQVSKYQELKNQIKLSKNKSISKEESGFPALKPASSNNLGRGGVFYTINGKQGIRAEMCDSPMDLAYKIGVSLENFLEYNDITDKQVLEIGQVYYAEPKIKTGPIPFHIVKEYETLWSISHSYGIKLSSLLDKNRIDNIQRLQAGRVLWLQNKRPSKTEVEIIELPKNEDEEVDLVTDLDEVFVEEEPIKGANLIESVTKESKLSENTPLKVDKDSRIEEVLKAEPEKQALVEKTVGVRLKENVGQEFKTSLTKTSRSSDYMTHTVKKGETLYRISVNYKVSVDQLLRLNGLRNNEIEVGDTIRVKPL